MEESNESKTMNVYQRLLAIENELTNVAKNLSVGVGKSSYKAVGEADVLKAVKPLEAKYGVYSYPSSRRIVESAVLENEQTDYNNNKVIKKSFFERIETLNKSPSSLRNRLIPIFLMPRGRLTKPSVSPSSRPNRLRSSSLNTA